MNAIFNCNDVAGGQLASSISDVLAVSSSHCGSFCDLSGQLVPSRQCGPRQVCCGSLRSRHCCSTSSLEAAIITLTNSALSEDSKCPEVDRDDLDEDDGAQALNPLGYSSTTTSPTAESAIQWDFMLFVYCARQLSNVRLYMWAVIKSMWVEKWGTRGTVPSTVQGWRCLNSPLYSSCVIIVHSARAYLSGFYLFATVIMYVNDTIVSLKDGSISRTTSWSTISQVPSCTVLSSHSPYNKERLTLIKICFTI